MRQTRAAAVGLLIDVGLMAVGVAAGWFSAGELLVAAWMQTAVPVVVVPALLLWAVLRAPDDPAVDAGEALTSDGVELRGKRAAKSLLLFFPFHYGIFMVVLGGFVWRFVLGAGSEQTLSLALPLLFLRAVVANVPTAVADARFVRRDDFAYLAQKSMSLMWRPYARMVPLHLGALIIFGPMSVRAAEVPAFAIVAVVAAITFAGSLIRYPELPSPGPVVEGAEGVG